MIELNRINGLNFGFGWRDDDDEGNVIEQYFFVINRSFDMMIGVILKQIQNQIQSKTLNLININREENKNKIETKARKVLCSNRKRIVREKKTNERNRFFFRISPNS